jgi:hypothetical protein
MLSALKSLAEDIYKRLSEMGFFCKVPQHTHSTHNALLGGEGFGIG